MAKYEFERDGEKIEIEVDWAGDGYEARIGEKSWRFKLLKGAGSGSGEQTGGGTVAQDASEPNVAEGGEVLSPLSGKVLEVMVNVGDSVKSGDDLVKLEAMKLETVIPAPQAGTVDQVYVNEGESVEEEDKLVTFKGE